jgi:hypothetical protein
VEYKTIKEQLSFLRFYNLGITGAATAAGEAGWDAQHRRRRETATVSRRSRRGGRRRWRRGGGPEMASSGRVGGGHGRQRGLKGCAAPETAGNDDGGTG